jgi:hypothetical protein
LWWKCLAGLVVVRDERGPLRLRSGQAFDFAQEDRLWGLKAGSFDALAYGSAEALLFHGTAIVRGEFGFGLHSSQHSVPGAGFKSIMPRRLYRYYGAEDGTSGAEARVALDGLLARVELVPFPVFVRPAMWGGELFLKCLAGAIGWAG